MEARENRFTGMLKFLLLLLNLKQSCLHETHTLRYDFIVTSLNESWEFLPRILIFIDEELFLSYKGDNRRAGAWGPRFKGLAGADSWATGIEHLWKKKEQLGRMLAEVMSLQVQNKGIHTLQETFSCELQGNKSIRGFWRLGYNGRDTLTFDQKTLTWTVAMPFTQQTKTFWETHAPRADQVKIFLEDLCPTQFQGYLAAMRNISLDTGFPRVIVIKKPYPVGRITLKCWAFNLLSRMTNLTWLQNGKPTQQYTLKPGTILPSGDGTYQTWLSTWVLPGQEAEFTCYLRHQTDDICVPAISNLENASKSIHDAARSLAASAASIFPIVSMVLLAGSN